MNLKKYLENPAITIILFILANLFAFINILNDALIFTLGAVGNYILTFTFAFSLVLTGMNLDKKFNLKNTFKYISYFIIFIYFLMYLRFILIYNIGYGFGYLLMSFGIYKAIQISKNKKKLVKKDFF